MYPAVQFKRTTRADTGQAQCPQMQHEGRLWTQGLPYYARVNLRGGPGPSTMLQSYHVNVIHNKYVQ
jgi:hypothetical protein